jgi:hypothetical protein
MTTGDNRGYMTLCRRLDVTYIRGIEQRTPVGAIMLYVNINLYRQKLLKAYTIKHVEAC